MAKKKSSDVPVPDEPMSDEPAETPPAAPYAPAAPAAPEPAAPAKPRKRRGIVAPILLILVGVVFLLNNFGVLPWSVWATIWQAWPIILILVGLDLLIGRRSWWSTLLLVIVTLVVISGVVGFGLLRMPRGATVTETFSRDVGDTPPDRMVVRLEHGVAEQFVHASSDASKLVDARLDRGPDEKIQTDETQEDGTMVFSLKSVGREGLAFDWLPGRRRRWDVALNRSVPVELDLQAGVGASDLDFSGIALTGLDIQSGVGAQTVTLPDSGDIRVDVQSGVGALEVRVPRSLAVEMRVEGGLGGVDVPRSYRKDGDAYRSPGTGGGTLRLTIEGGIGAVDIEEI